MGSSPLLKTVAHAKGTKLTKSNETDTSEGETIGVTLCLGAFEPALSNWVAMGV